MNEGEELVREYFELIFQRDPAAFDLYAEDALFVMPSGDWIQGKEEIREHIKARYEHSPHLKPPTIEKIVSQGSTVVAIVEATFEDDVLKAVDVFEIEAGKIQSLSIYRQDVKGAPTPSDCVDAR
jgi:ketosteroid isomerase-like protein